ncbi:hypothetical protein BDP27DRAFT_1238893 [Rhodocollybia butyracea]|uniref:RING-type domain-containing protein n=1 Tax=Rhodocollybia butyracea TaxID=206335 RepID=A0A9P5P9F6_9AGAR|nr:hypothetical protein BDP27DRAFT_1238893 [Rhodocollybia butyracea]
MSLNILLETDPGQPFFFQPARHRAETRPCPICNEQIPLRLLGKHAELEASRVDEIIGHIGSDEPFLDLSYESYAFAFPAPDAVASTSALASSSRSASSGTGRRSAVRARQSILEKTHPIKAQRAHSTVVTKTIQGIKRNRKNRHAKLRDMTREDDEGHLGSRLRYTSARGEIVCPVCLATVTGDEEVQDAHVEACVTNESRRLEEERERREMQQREEAEEVDLEGEADAAGYFGNVRGTGFHSRNHNEHDVEDDIDIDGDDAEIFGTAQFDEGDILDVETIPVSTTSSARTLPTSVLEQDGDQPAKVLRGLIAANKARHILMDATGISEMDQVDVAIIMAKKKGDRGALVTALENKNPVNDSQSPTPSPNDPALCRICLDPYSEPTVSTGCWHTCCRECWLRCLGSTKLCPICKRITAAIDLRRVYL